jgi:hypothetical protein
MPEEAVESTPLAKEIAAKTLAATKEQGLVLDKALDDEFEAAVAKDLGKAPPAPPSGQPAPPKPPEGEDLEDDLPPELFKPKEEPPKPKTEAEKLAEHEAMVKEQTKGMSAKASDRFREIAKRAFDAEQKAIRAETLEKELATLKSAPPPVAVEEMEKLRKQNKELDEIVMKQRLADHPAFRSFYDAKITENINVIKGVLPSDKFAELEPVLRAPDSKHRREAINEISADLGDAEKADFLAALGSLNATVREREGKIANASAEWDKVRMVQEENQQKQAAVTNEAMTNAWNQTHKKLSADPNEGGLEMFREIPNNEQWNAGVRERVERAKAIFGKGPTPEAMAELAMMAVALPNYRDLFIMQRTMSAKLKARLAELQGSEPVVRSGEGSKASDYDSNESFVDAVVKGAMKEGFLKQ